MLILSVFQPHLDPSILNEFFSPIEDAEPKAVPPTTAEYTTSLQRELPETHPDGEVREFLYISCKSIAITWKVLSVGLELLIRSF